MQFFFKLLSHSLRLQRVRELEQATPFRAVLIHLLCGADDWLKVAWINDSLTTRWRERTEVKHTCDLSDRRIYHLHWLLISCQRKHRHHRNHHHHYLPHQQHQQQQYKRFECWPRARGIIPIARYSSKRRRPNWAKIKLLVLDDAIQVIHDGAPPCDCRDKSSRRDLWLTTRHHWPIAWHQDAGGAADEGSSIGKELCDTVGWYFSSAMTLQGSAVVLARAVLWTQGQVVNLYDGDIHVVDQGIFGFVRESDSGLRANSAWNVVYHRTRWTALRPVADHARERQRSRKWRACDIHSEDYTVQCKRAVTCDWKLHRFIFLQ